MILTISDGMDTFSLQVPLTKTVSPGFASAIFCWTFSPTSQSTVNVAASALRGRSRRTRAERKRLPFVSFPPAFDVTQVLTIEYMDRNINIGKGRSQGDERSFRLITISFNRCSTGSGLGKDLSAALIRIQTLLPIYKAHASEVKLH